MRTMKLGGGFAIAFVVGSGAACQVHIVEGPAQVAQAPAPAPAPAPRPVAAPAPIPVPAPPAPTRAGPETVHPIGNVVLAAARGGLVPRQLHVRTLQFRRVAPHPAMNAPSPKNLAAIQQLRSRAPAPCGPAEMVRNVFVQIDCNRYTPPAYARPSMMAKKIKLLKSHKLRLDAVNTSSLASAGYPAAEGGGGVYPATEAGELPASIDHRKDGIEGPVKDQENVGACTAFSLSTAMDNAIRRLNKADAISAMHLWSHYGYPNMKNAGDGNLNKAIAVWDDWPYSAPLACRMYTGGGQFGCGNKMNPPVVEGSAQNDSTVQAQIALADAKGKYKITAIESIPFTDIETVFPAALAQGKDIWLGIQTGSEGSWRWDHLDNNQIRDYASDGGGHAVALAGYRTSAGNRQYLIHNSWTAEWGDGGYAWINESQVKLHFQLAYTITVEATSATSTAGCPAGQVKNPILATDTACYATCSASTACAQGSNCTAVPGGAAGAGFCTPGQATCDKTDDDCKDDELVDSQLCVCASMCADDTRPSSGRCGITASGGHR